MVISLLEHYYCQNSNEKWLVCLLVISMLISCQWLVILIDVSEWGYINQTIIDNGRIHQSNSIVSHSLVILIDVSKCGYIHQTNMDSGHIHQSNLSVWDGFSLLCVGMGTTSRRKLPKTWYQNWTQEYIPIFYWWQIFNSCTWITLPTIGNQQQCLRCRVKPNI